MPLPETIAVKYTEEDAEALSIRPVVRQTFRVHELLDMILSVTGKDAPRVQKILRSGTVVFHFYRYRWEGFDADAPDLAAALAAFPDADPSRVFRAEACVSVALDTGSHTPPEWKRADADKRRLLRGKSFWSALWEAIASESPRYDSYSYERKADVFTISLADEHRQRLWHAGEQFLPAAQRGPLAALPKTRRLLFFCPR